MPYEYNPTYNNFSFQRVRFDFEATAPRRFPEGKAGNVFRGALGWALRESNPDRYAEFFDPHQSSGAGPSGFANPPRPFVLRVAHLDGRTFQPGETFQAYIHLFRQAPADVFIRAMARIPLGRFVSASFESMVVPLAKRASGVSRLTVRFLTPTELKTAGAVSPNPDFPVLFSRARDRIRALCDDDLTLYFAGMAQQARGVTMVSHHLTHEKYRRTSRKTGQRHAIGGFLGEACYEGAALQEFIPLLEAARWTGIGRQTVWGKGAIELEYDRTVA